MFQWDLDAFVGSSFFLVHFVQQKQKNDHKNVQP